MAQEMKVVCPHCTAVLSVRNSKNEAYKEIVCPNCKASLRVRFAANQQQADEGKAVIGGARNNYPDPDKTCIIHKSAGSYILSSEGRTYKLKDGLNTIGRRATTSQASIQIETTSVKMSRNHARLEQLRLPDGGVKLRLSNWQNQNPTFVNGMELKGTDVRTIQDGYEIKMADVIISVIKL
jgi:uncharacterized protein YbaR (Trm112 family)